MTQDPSQVARLSTDEGYSMSNDHPGASQDMTPDGASAGAEPSAPRIGIVRWGDPTNADGPTYYGLRINGAYVSRGGAPVGYRSAAEARRAKAAYKKRLAGRGGPDA